MTAAPTHGHGHHHHQLLRGRRLAWLAVFLGLGVAVAVLLIRSDLFDGSPSSNSLEGSGIPATQTRHVPSFNSIDLAGSNNVTVRVGPSQKVVVHADDNLIGHVTTIVRNGTLVIANTHNFATNGTMGVNVSVAGLRALTLKGSGIIEAVNVDAPALTVTLPGSGLLRVSGTVERLDVSLGGSGDAQLDGLVARDVHAVVSGSGRILVQATRSLDATVTGSGAIVYSGSPAHVTSNVSGSGAITPG